MLLHFLLWSVMVLITIRHPDRVFFFSFLGQQLIFCDFDSSVGWSGVLALPHRFQSSEFKCLYAVCTLMGCLEPYYSLSNLGLKSTAKVEVLTAISSTPGYLDFSFVPCHLYPRR